MPNPYEEKSATERFIDTAPWEREKERTDKPNNFEELLELLKDA